jgi:hypothetical protein
MRWTLSALGALGLCLFAAPALAGEVKGTFIGPGVYATPEGCAKWKAVEAGGDRNVETVPDVLSQDGFSGWEGACTFRSIIEMEPGKMWKASMDCHEGATEGPETDIFEKLPDGSLKMTIMDHATTLVRCDADKGK